MKQLNIPVAIQVKGWHLFTFHHAGMLCIQQLIQYLSQMADDCSARNKRDMEMMRSCLEWTQETRGWRVWYDIKPQSEEISLEIEPIDPDTTLSSKVVEGIADGIEQYLKMVFPFHQLLVELELSKAAVS